MLIEHELCMGTIAYHLARKYLLIFPFDRKEAETQRAGGQWRKSRAVESKWNWWFKLWFLIFFFFFLRSLSRTKGLIRWMGATWCPCGVTLRLTSLLCVVGLPSLFSYCGTGYTGRGHRGFPARRSRFSSAADWMTCGRLLLLLWTLTLKWKWHLSELWETLGKCFVNGITRDKEKKHYLQ